MQENMPHHIGMARCRVGSPGFIGILGDPKSLTTLVALLASLLVERRFRRQHLLSLKRDQRETVSTLIEMGYNRTEIASVSQYLNEHLSEILVRLEKARAQVAPGDAIDPSTELYRGEDETRKQK